MTKYIPLEPLLAEIDRKLRFCNNWIEGDKRRQTRTTVVSSSYYKMLGSKHTCESILDAINALEVKEVDLKEEIDKIWKPRFSLGWDKKSLLSISYEGFEIIAKNFFELGLKAQKGE